MAREQQYRPQMIEVESANLQSVGFLPEKGKTPKCGELYVRFNSGATYVYHRVPVSVANELAQIIRNEQSVGAFFRDHVRDVFDNDRVEQT